MTGTDRSQALFERATRVILPLTMRTILLVTLISVIDVAVSAVTMP